jgi:DNA adenine methylase
MKYVGSKNRIAKHILPIMLRYRKPNQTWIEPFVGGGNMIDKVKGKRLGADINPRVIEALLSIRDNLDELPKNKREFTEEDYKKLRTNIPIKHKGYAGFALSYGGKWLGGVSRDGEGRRDYIAEAYRNATIQSAKLQGVELICTSYDQLEIPSNSLIYCDPPYKGTTEYAHKFLHEPFYNWCRTKTREGHTVFVSETTAPTDFICIWQLQRAASLTRNTGSKLCTEKLYIIKPQSDITNA